jgi:hypothetical protein
MAGPKMEDWLPIIRRRATALFEACYAIKVAMVRGDSDDGATRTSGLEALVRLDEAVPGDFRGGLRWSRFSEQIFRIDKWSVCQG